MSHKDPAFLFYPEKWIVGAAGMKWEAKGVYIHLLAFQHQKNGLPVTPEELAELIGMELQAFLTVWNTYGLCKKFSEKDGKLFNERLHEIMHERSHQAKVNKIIAVYREVLKKLNLSQKDREEVKKTFDVSIFLNETHETLHESITKWLTNRSTNLIDIDTNTINNTNTGVKDRKLPQDFLKERDEVHFDVIRMRAGILDEEELAFAITQWGLKVFEAGFEYSPDSKKDYAQLSAGLEKWLNSWQRNSLKKTFKSGQGNSAGEQKPEFRRIIPS